METTEERTDYEQERGKPLPSVNHSRLQIRLSVALFEYEPEYTVLSELALELDGNRFTPDLCVYPSLEVNYQCRFKGFLWDGFLRRDAPRRVASRLNPQQTD